MKSDIKIVVLLPCYNEEKSIVQTILDFKMHVPDGEIIVFDNNSTDKTAELARQEDVQVVSSLKKGKGNVIRHMLSAIDADVYLIADGDYTYSARDACKLVKAVQLGADMAIGDRLSADYYASNFKISHNFGNKLVRYLVNKLWHGSIPDIMTGCRALSRDFAESLCLKSQGFEIETEISIQALQKKANVVSIPIEYRDRLEGSVSKIRTYKDGLKIIKFIFKTKLFNSM